MNNDYVIIIKDDKTINDQYSAETFCKNYLFNLNSDNVTIIDSNKKLTDIAKNLLKEECIINILNYIQKKHDVYYVNNVINDSILSITLQELIDNSNSIEVYAL